jgi:hypothetical protein
MPLEVGLFLQASSDYIDIGDQVEVTRRSDAREVNGRRSIQLNPGEKGTVSTVPNDQWVEVRMASGKEFEIDLDDLRKVGLVLALETHDESQENPTNAGAFAVDTPDVIQGYETEADQTKDNPTDVTASRDNLPPFVRPDFDNLDGESDHHDPDHDGELEVYSDDEIPADDRLRSVTNKNSSLEWLMESDEPTHKEGAFDGFDPMVLDRIYKNSAKNYTMSEQAQLVDEDGVSDSIDHLNLANSFYEMD